MKAMGVDILTGFGTILVSPHLTSSVSEFLVLYVSKYLHLIANSKLFRTLVSLTFLCGNTQGPQKLKFGDKTITAKDIIIATGSVPLVPKGIEVDGSCLSALHIFCCLSLETNCSRFLVSLILCYNAVSLCRQDSYYKRPCS